LREIIVDADAIHRWWMTRAAGLAVAELRQITVEYWTKRQPTPQATPAERLAWYICTLMPEELYHADVVRHALTYPTCHTLVLLVGHSPEPLLQTISVFQPRRVALLLNQWYGTQRGETRGAELAGWITQWLAPMLPRPPALEVHEVADRPDAVFQALSQYVLVDRQAGKPVIVDITGAKKSMDAGAFLFAAYADLPISYVDFDDYDETYRRPYGFHCRIGTLTNPYDAFRLREWERVRRMVEGYHFRAAGETLAEIVAQEHNPAAKRLLEVVRFYEAWDDGDYGRAGRLLTDLQRELPTFTPPVAVRLLSGIWPSVSATMPPQAAAIQLLQQHARLRQAPGSIFESDELLLAYARDELARIERLVSANEDNRSALLRAAGLDELLLKARWLHLWQQGWIEVWDGGGQAQGSLRGLGDAKLIPVLHDAILNHQGTDFMRWALQRVPSDGRQPDSAPPAYLRIEVFRESARETYRLRPAQRAPTLTAYERDAGLTGATLTDLRNQAIHMYLGVTQTLAQAAVRLARANLADFEARWAPLSRARVTAPAAADVYCLPWDDLCRLCGLGNLPLTTKEHA
jgi:hypothetical protein